MMILKKNKGIYISSPDTAIAGCTDITIAKQEKKNSFLN